MPVSFPTKRPSLHAYGGRQRSIGCCELDYGKPMKMVNVTDKPWSMEDLANMIDAAKPAPSPRGSYEEWADASK